MQVTTKVHGMQGVAQSINLTGTQTNKDNGVLHQQCISSILRLEMYVHTIATFVGIPIDAMQHQPLELLQAFWTYHMKTSNLLHYSAYPLSPKPTFATFLALHHSYSIAGNFRGRKLLQFRGYSRKFFCEIWGHSVLWCGKSKQSARVSPRKSYFSPIHESLLPRKFPAIWYHHSQYKQSHSYFKQ